MRIYAINKYRTVNAVWRENGETVIDHGGDTVVTSTIDGWRGATELNNGCLPPGDYGNYRINSVTRRPDGSLHADITITNPVDKAINGFLNMFLMNW